MVKIIHCITPTRKSVFLAPDSFLFYIKPNSLAPDYSQMCGKACANWQVNNKSVVDDIACRIAHRLYVIVKEGTKLIVLL